VTRQALCFQPKLATVRRPGDCTAGVFLEPAWDPVRREATYRQRADAPPLLEETIYALTLYAPIEDTDGGFRALEGASFEAIPRFELRVGTAGASPLPVDTLPRGEHYCASAKPGCASACAPTCAAQCAGDAACEASCTTNCLEACPRSVAEILGPTGCGSCHGGAQAAEGLDLASRAGLEDTAFGHAAHGTQVGGHARVAEENPARFGRAMPILDRGVPGNSYLVYKLLANPATPLEVPFPGDPVNGLPPEVARLRDAVVVGMPMPPSTSSGLRPGEPEWISDWLLQGAPAADACGTN
jgi:hypothetical protein